MKISSNHNLLPYVKNPYEIIPAVSPDLEQRSGSRQQAILNDNDTYRTNSLKYYVRSDDENAVYNVKSRLITQQWQHVGMLVDVYG